MSRSTPPCPRGRTWGEVGSVVHANLKTANDSRPNREQWQGEYAQNFHTWWTGAFPGMTTLAHVAGSMREALEQFAAGARAAQQDLDSAYGMVRGLSVPGTFGQSEDGCWGTLNSYTLATETQAAPDAQVGIRVYGWDLTVVGNGGASASGIASTAALAGVVNKLNAAKMRLRASGTAAASTLETALAALKSDTAFRPISRATAGYIDNDGTGLSDPTWRDLAGTAGPGGKPRFLLRPDPGLQFGDVTITNTLPQWYGQKEDHKSVLEKITDFMHDELTDPLTIASMFVGVGEERLGLEVAVRGLRAVLLLNSGGKVVGDLATGAPPGLTLKDLGGLTLEGSEGVGALSNHIARTLAPGLSGKALNSVTQSISSLMLDHLVPEGGGEKAESLAALKGRQHLSVAGLDAVTAKAQAQLRVLGETANH